MGELLRPVFIEIIEGGGFIRVDMIDDYGKEYRTFFESDRFYGTNIAIIG